MESLVIGLSQKDINRLGNNLKGTCIAHNCNTYEAMLQDKEWLFTNLGYNPNIIESYCCWQIAYSYSQYGCSGQLHRIEVDTYENTHITMFVWYTNIHYREY